MRTLLVAGHVYSMSERFATAMLIDDDVVAWIGTDAGAQVHLADVDRVVDLGGDLLAPGFVHLGSDDPDPDQGFLHAERAPVPRADRWAPQAWERAAQQPLAVVPRDPCRLRSRIAAGVPTALVPDRLEPSGWETVRSAVYDVAPQERLSPRAAFSALTRGAWRILGHPDRGVLNVGAQATFVQWAVTDLVVEAPDERVSNWSTDPRAATPGLPPLAPGDRLPEVRSVWRAGEPG
ncbi:MAG: amidohydrolase family protein [Candidatus Nanopelagicales bacterium]